MKDQIKIGNYFNKINYHTEKKQYKKSCYHEKKLLPLISADDKLYSFINKQHGITLFNLKKYKQAIKPLLLAEGSAKTAKELFDVHFHLYKSYYLLSDYHNLIRYGEKTLAFKNINPFLLAKISGVIGRFNYLLYLQTSRKIYLIRGLYYSTESEKLYRELNYVNSRDYFYAVYDCADINYKLEDYDSAIPYYEKIIATTNNVDLLFGVYTNLVNIYKEKGFTETMLFYKKKLSLLY